MVASEDQVQVDGVGQSFDDAASDDTREGRRIVMAQLKSLLQVNALSFLNGIGDGIYSARKMRWRARRVMWLRGDKGAAEWDNAEAEAAAIMVGIDRDALADVCSDSSGSPLELPLLSDDGQTLRVYRGDGVAVARIDKLELWEAEIVMQLVGWEWDPRRLEVCQEDGDNDGGEESIVWSRYDTACARNGLECYLEIMRDVEYIEPDDGEFDESDAEDSDDESEHKPQAAVREEQVQAEAFALLKSGEAASLAYGLELAEKRVLKRSFESVDADGSGRVDSEEVLNAFRQMGLAATEADVAKMMASVDEGGRLASLVAKVGHLRHVEAQLVAGGLGLKEKEKAELEHLEAQMQVRPPALLWIYRIR
jgi:hypothetical protein